MVYPANGRLSEDGRQDWLLNVDSDSAQRCCTAPVQKCLSAVK